jgi:hypothetical protein
MGGNERGERRKSNRSGEFNQSAFYACMEISQLNLYVQVIHTIKKIFSLIHRRKCLSVRTPQKLLAKSNIK